MGGGDDDMTVHLAVDAAPVSSARSWVGNARCVLDAVEAHPEKVPFRVPAEVMCAMRDLLSTMTPSEALSDEEPFVVMLTVEPVVMRDLITYWFNISQLTAEQQARLGVELENPPGRPFGNALGAAVGAAMVAHPDLAEFAQRLAREWEECQPAFAAAAAAAR